MFCTWYTCYNFNHCSIDISKFKNTTMIFFLLLQDKKRMPSKILAHFLYRDPPLSALNWSKKNRAISKH